MRLKTYIINLEKSTVRKQYMQDLLSPYSFLDVEFVKAIDGRQLSEGERALRFDYAKSMRVYGRSLNAGEIGCALSHRKAYEMILVGSDPYALILEDDIAILRDLNQLPLEKIDKLMRSSRPRAFMLSGDYCFYRQKPVIRAFSAIGAYAYLINKAAAKRILAINPPCCVADDWMYYKRKGLRLFAVYPYMIDANLNMDLLSSDVKQDKWGLDRSKMSLKENILRASSSFFEKIFKKYNHYEYKTFVYGNKIQDRNKIIINKIKK